MNNDDLIHNNTQVWSGFHKKALKERQTQLQITFPHLFLPQRDNRNNADISPVSTPALSPIASTENMLDIGQWSNYRNSSLFPIRGLSEEIADNMIENCVGTLGLPVGIVPYLVVNGKDYVVPMATEEPSVVAACCSAAKTICSVGSGFTASTALRNTIDAQIQLVSLPADKIEDLKILFEASRNEIIEEGNRYCQKMVARGGGVVDVSLRVIPRKTGRDGFWAVVHLVIDVSESMGANCANTVAEKTAPFIERILGVETGVKIVSNLSKNRITRASFKIPIAKMGYKSLPGDVVVSRIYDAYCWANDDHFRAVTHNKGIMNGIDAVAIACGQDFRAIEAAAHAYANGVLSNDAHYGSLTRYWTDGDLFCGELCLPLQLGVVGGSIRTNPVYKYTLGMMGNPSSAELAQVMVAVGLAQNFAAIRALVTTGIQKGHMSLHARNIAVAAGTPTKYVTEVSSYLVAVQNITQDAAQEYLHAREIHQKIYQSVTPEYNKLPSVLLFEDSDDNSNSLRVNIAFQTFTETPVTLALTKSSSSQTAVSKIVLGEKSHEWMIQIIRIFTNLTPGKPHHARNTYLLQKKLKLISILIHLILRNLLFYAPYLTQGFVTEILDKLCKYTFSARQDFFIRLLSKYVETIRNGTMEQDVKQGVIVGTSLLMSLWQVFEFHVSQWVGTKILQKKLLEQHQSVIADMISYASLPGSDKAHDEKEIERFASYSRRFQMEIVLLIDVMSLEESMVSKAYLNWSVSAGRYLDVLLAWAHDIARSDSRKYDHLKQTFSSQSKFLSRILHSEFVLSLRADLEHGMDGIPEELVDKRFLERIIEGIEKWYGVSFPS